MLPLPAKAELGARSQGFGIMCRHVFLGCRRRLLCLRLCNCWVLGSTGELPDFPRKIPSLVNSRAVPWVVFRYQLDFSCETEEEMRYIVAGFRAMVAESVGAGAGSSAFGSQSWVRKTGR